MIFSKLQSELVVSNHIFQFLGWNDLLRLRHVCKDAKILAEDYLRLHGTLKRFVRITDENVFEFLSLAPNLPISRFRLDNKDNVFFEREEMQTLVDLYGDKITHLSLRFLGIPLDKSPKVVQFFDSLPNLYYLDTDLDLFQSGHERRESDEEDSPAAVPTRELMLPSVFKRLRHLKLREYDCNADPNSIQYLWTFLEECSAHLETIMLPILMVDMNLADIPSGGEFGCVKRIVERRHEERPNDPNMRMVGLDEISEDESYPRATSFYELVSTCSQHNVKLANVNANFVEGMMRLDTPDMADHGRKISSVVTSLWGIHSSSFPLELPHLTQVRIDDGDAGTSQLCSMPPGRIERQTWPNLKELEITVDSESVVDSDGLQVATSELLNFFFNGIRRENMENLKMSFYADEDENCTEPIPKLRDVCSSCPNLKILEILNWQGTNKAISKLWGNLPFLETLTFTDCEDLEDSAFIGRDIANPAMLKMKSLRSLTLGFLVNMPKITDALFTSVLRHMSLKELHLRSGTNPLTSITVAGVSSLLVGEFATSIEKLKLDISLQDVTEEQLKELGKLFRSSKMM